MSPARLTLLAVMSVACVSWSAAALYAHMVRLQHQTLVADVRSGEKLPELPILDAAITSYTHAVRLLPCKMSLHHDLGLLLALRTDTALSSPDINQSSDALDTMQDALSTLLSCTPMDGKAWLDLAMINTYREGFTKRSLDAYKMSARVAPGESWLAEKRMLFALQFRPLLDDAARQIVEKDIIVLERAHPNRMTAVMEAVPVTSAEALKALFIKSAAQTPSTSSPL